MIISAAIPASNPELECAVQRGLAVATHAQVLGELSRQLRTVAIAGTHGKSTTTALTAHILTTCGLDPICLGGAYAPDLGGSGRAGAGKIMVVEADEYARRFLELQPWVAVITNLEADHLDIYGSLEELHSAFAEFAGRVPGDGHLVYCSDALISLDFSDRRSVRYGFADNADWRISDYRPSSGGIAFVVTTPDSERFPVSTSLRGRHNAQNATAAIVAASLTGVSADDAIRAVSTFSGTKRRFETVFRDDRVWVIDDYAHHPTEIRATLQAAREVHPGEIWVVFQPHTTHRTRSLFGEFVTSFADADRLILLPTYHPSGREHGTIDRDAEDLAESIQHRRVELASSIDDAAARVLASITDDTLIITMGAGDVTTLGPIRANAGLAPR